MIWDASDSLLKKVKPLYIATPGGSDTYVQFNDGGSTFGGDSGLTYNKTTDVLTVGGGIKITSGFIGIGTAGAPSYAADVVGDVNNTSTYKINGTTVLSATTLGSGVTNSSLTSLGTITTLNAGTGTFSGAITGLSLSVNNGISGASGFFTGPVSSASLSTGNVTGATATFSGPVTAASVTATGIVSGRDDSVYVSSNSNVSAQKVYVVGANSITLTLPASPANGDRISFRPKNSNINTYTIARNGNQIMELSENLSVNVYAPFDLMYASVVGATGWILEIGRAHV